MGKERRSGGVGVDIVCIVAAVVPAETGFWPPALTISGAAKE
jgi:hypothetical protein